jgi:hypothetical protein
MFKFLLGLVALSVAGCAAFFSVQGVASLYSDQFLAVCIMASSLEVGKLVAATYLHRYWSACGALLKSYLTVAVAILMAITSLGIFGFLTSAYQKNFSQVELVDSKQEIFQSRKSFLEKEIASLNERITTLNEARSGQEKRLPNLSRLAAKPIYDDIERAGKEIQATREKIDDLSKQLMASTDEVIELKAKKNEHHDIGTLQFVANALDVKVEHVVNWFTLIIVLVFDPLALSLILAYSSLTKKKILSQNNEPPYSDDLTNNISEFSPTEKNVVKFVEPKLNSTSDVLTATIQKLPEQNQSEETFKDINEGEDVLPQTNNETQKEDAKIEQPMSYEYVNHLNEIINRTTNSSQTTRNSTGKYRA